MDQVLESALFAMTGKKSNRANMDTGILEIEEYVQSGDEKQIGDSSGFTLSAEAYVKVRAVGRAERRLYQVL